MDIKLSNFKYVLIIIFKFYEYIIKHYCSLRSTFILHYFYTSNLKIKSIQKNHENTKEQYKKLLKYNQRAYTVEKKENMKDKEDK